MCFSEDLCVESGSHDLVSLSVGFIVWSEIGIVEITLHAGGCCRGKDGVG